MHLTLKLFAGLLIASFKGCDSLMTAAGFPQAKAMPDASLSSGNVPAEQSEPFAVAEYTCGVEYPMAMTPGATS